MDKYIPQGGKTWTFIFHRVGRRGQIHSTGWEDVDKYIPYGGKTWTNAFHSVGRHAQIYFTGWEDVDKYIPQGGKTWTNTGCLVTLLLQPCWLSHYQ